MVFLIAAAYSVAVYLSAGTAFFVSAVKRHARTKTVHIASSPFGTAVDMSEPHRVMFNTISADFA
jgi:hypothetical protein